MGKFQGKRYLGMDIEVICWGRMDWFIRAQDKDKWCIILIKVHCPT
jgi:hypothetical protein